MKLELIASAKGYRAYWLVATDEKEAATLRDCMEITSRLFSGNRFRFAKEGVSLNFVGSVGKIAGNMNGAGFDRLEIHISDPDMKEKEIAEEECNHATYEGLDYCVRCKADITPPADAKGEQPCHQGFKTVLDMERGAANSTICNLCQGDELFPTQPVAGRGECEHKRIFIKNYSECQDCKEMLPPPPASTPEGGGEERITSYVVDICDDCYALKGKMCHTPGCIFIRMTMDEVGVLLDQFSIRPVLDGVRESLGCPLSRATAAARAERDKVIRAARGQFKQIEDEMYRISQGEETFDVLKIYKFVREVGGLLDSLLPPSPEATGGYNQKMQ